jgi:hypothetical protein
MLSAAGATREWPTGKREREADLIARWNAGVWRGSTLRAADGATYQVIYQGRPGGPVGPDFRDAVLRTASGRRVLGDVELHLTPSGWREHRHGTDPRYNNIALHVTLRSGACDGAGTPLASGGRAPLVALAAQSDALAHSAQPPAPWPCEPLEAGSLVSERMATLRQAGWARLRGRASALLVARARERLTPTSGGARWNADDRALFIALAEALGYGRDRDALRQCGERLVAGATPDALLAEATRLGAVEQRRVVGLVALGERWRASGPLAALRDALMAGAARAGPVGAGRALVAEVATPGKRIVSLGRARIVTINVALPYLLLDAREACDAARWERVVTAIEVFPGLASNQITRVMAAQIGLARAPAGALAQQGLQHVWTRHCREKRCVGCPLALRNAEVWKI